MTNPHHHDLDLHFFEDSPNHFSVRAMENGNVAAQHKFELHTDELKLIEGLRRLEENAIASSAKEKETFHIEFGKELYTKMFSGELGDYFEKCHKDAKNDSETLRIYLRFDESTQKIAALPWEFLHNGDTFLVTKRNTVISRLPSGVNKSKFRPLESILRMLVVVSSPDDPGIPPLNTEHEQEVILEGVDPLYRENKIEVDFTEDASFETIGSYLIEKDYHIVHFTGHGTYKNGKGYLCLETEDAKARMVDNRSIADLLADRGVRLVVLSACVSGKVSNKEAYSDLASILVKENIPAVVAMQYPILDISAIQFASVFYKTLSSGRPVDLALAEARIAMKNTEKSNGVDFATPVLYLSDPDCIKIDEIKPVTSELLHRPEMLLKVQVMDKGFVGRRKELRLLQKGFKSDVKRAAIIHGFGGIGKTVLASRLALNMDKHFIGIFGMKCTATTTPADILNELNAFLNLAGIQEFNHVLYGQIPLKVKTLALVNILNQRRFLIILDNFEDCLDETKSDIADPELKEFIQHLLNNTRTNTKFIITTRYNFDPLEGRLTGSIEHISLTELPFPQSVWIMNNHSELVKLDIKEKYRIYESIGGHPWTIGVFAKHASAGTVDNLLMELEPVKKELIDFTLLDKSYTQLDKQAKTLLLKASIYQETVTEEALMWIMGDQDQPSPSVGNALEMLINWGLMAREHHRDEILFAMHTLVKDFARQEAEKEQLDPAPLLIRTAQYYENLAKTTGNIWDHLKAREYYYEAGEWEKAHQILVSTYYYLVRWGYIELGMNLLDQSIKTTSGATQAEAKGELANLHCRLGNFKTASKIYNEIKEIFETIGDKSGIANTLHQLGNIHQDQGNYQETVKLYQQSMEINEELGDKSGIAITLHQLGNIHQDQGNYQEAEKLYQQSMEIKEELGNKSGIANTLHQLGIIHQNQGNYQEAAKLYQQSMEIQKELGNKSGIASTLGQLGQLHEEHGKDYTSALEKYMIAYFIFKELQAPQAELAQKYIARIKENIGEDAFKTAIEEIRRRHDDI